MKMKEMRKGNMYQLNRIILLLSLPIILLGQATPTNPSLPITIPTGKRPSPTGSVVVVHSGDDLQAKYNAAACGSDLVLDDGATFTGAYVFNKQCTSSNWILVEGTACKNNAPIPVYVTTGYINSSANPPIPPPSLTHYATLTASGGTPPLLTTDGTTPGKYNYFGCLEVNSPTAGQFYLIGTTNGLTETITSQLCDNIIFDRMYAHGLTASSTIQMIRAFIIAGSNISVVNSYASNIYWGGGDSQAILGALGPGPYLITNNFLSAPTEVIMFGGTGKTPGYNCTIAASPAPTTTSATVNTCVDANGNTVATPLPGVQVMFYTSASMPYYTPLDWTTIISNTAGALTFSAIPTAPISGSAKIAWGIATADITVTKNYLWKDPTWNPSDPSYDGIARQSKNFLECKYCQRINANGNVGVNSWNAGQQYAFNFNSADQNGDCPWCYSSDVTFQNNILKNISADFVILSTQAGGSNGSCPPFLNRVLIKNNLFYTAGASPYIAHTGPNWFIGDNNGGCTYPAPLQGTDSLQIIHNTFLGNQSNGQIADDWPFNFSNLVVKDNITEFDQTRWFQAASGCTEPCFTNGSTTSGTWTASNNAIVNSGIINGGSGISDATIISRYGAIVLSTLYDTSSATNYSTAPFLNYVGVNSDYHNFKLTGAGAWINAASDGTNPGVNFNLLDAALGINLGGITMNGNIFTKDIVVH